VGGALGIAQLPLPMVELAIAASVIALGAMIAVDLQMPIAAATATIAGFALFHGHAHGSEMPAALAALDYTMGFMLATALLHGAGIALGYSVSRRGERYCRLAYAVSGGAMVLAGLGLAASAI